MRYRFLAVLALIACVTAQPNPPAATPQDYDSVTLDETRLRVHFIDIGPGLAVLIETPDDRKRIFIDGGKWGLSELEDYVEQFAPPEGSSNEQPIDIAIVTHADYDHYRGMQKIFASHEVREFVYTGYTSTDLPPSWADFLGDVQEEEGCAIYSPISDWFEPGDRETIDDGGTPADTSDDVVLTYLNVDANPPERDPIFGRTFDEGQRRNNASLVFKITYGQVSFLFTGDINGRDKDHGNGEFEREIDSEELEFWVRHKLDSSKYGLTATVLQAPHHGSNGSCSLPFLEAVDPDWVVIPAGHQYNHPHPLTLERIRRVVADDHILRTDEGDSTPENSARDARSDDCYVFETDGTEINRILRLRVD